MPNYDLKCLSAGERFWIARRNLNITQQAMAKRFRMGIKIYNRVERDLEDAICVVPQQPREVLQVHLCALARRRDGRDLREIAELVGVSHVTLLAMERRNDPKLVMAWRAIGYRF